MKRKLVQNRSLSRGTSVLSSLSIPGAENDIQRTNSDYLWANHSSHRVPAQAIRSVYVLCGYKWTGTPAYVANTQRYDVFTDAWVAGTAAGAAVWQAYGAAIGWYLIKVGGYTTSSQTTCEEYSIFAAAFSALSALGTAAQGRQVLESLMEARGQIEYGFGVQTILSYERFTDARTTLTNQTNSRSGQSGTAFGKSAAIANGYDGANNVNETLLYSRGPDAWSTATAVGAAWRAGVHGAEHSNKLWIVCLYNTAVRNTAKNYLLGADTWRTPTAASKTGADGPINAVFNGKIMMLGPDAGGTTAGTTVQGYHFRTEAEFNVLDNTVRQSYCMQGYHV